MGPSSRAVTHGRGGEDFSWYLEHAPVLRRRTGSLRCLVLAAWRAAPDQVHVVGLGAAVSPPTAGVQRRGSADWCPRKARREYGNRVSALTPRTMIVLNANGCTNVPQGRRRGLQEGAHRLPEGVHLPAEVMHTGVHLLSPPVAWLGRPVDEVLVVQGGAFRDERHDVNDLLAVLDQGRRALSAHDSERPDHGAEGLILVCPGDRPSASQQVGCDGHGVIGGQGEGHGGITLTGLAPLAAPPTGPRRARSSKPTAPGPARPNP